MQSRRIPICGLSFLPPSSESESNSDSESKDNQPVGVLGSLTPEELEKLKEAVDERKKLITTLKGKPWPMKKKIVTLRYVLSLLLLHMCTPAFIMPASCVLSQGVTGVCGEIWRGFGKRQRQETVRLQGHDDEGEELIIVKLIDMNLSLCSFRVIFIFLYYCNCQKWTKFQRDLENFKTACIPWEMKIKEIESVMLLNLTFLLSPAFFSFCFLISKQTLFWYSYRSFWFISCLLLYISEVDVWHKYDFIWTDIWVSNGSRGEKVTYWSNCILTMKTTWKVYFLKCNQSVFQSITISFTLKALMGKPYGSIPRKTVPREEEASAMNFAVLWDFGVNLYDYTLQFKTLRLARFFLFERDINV